MRKIYTNTLLALTSLLMASAAQAALCAVKGETKKWHKVILECEGPETSETAVPNPFTDYRMNVTFEIDGKEMLVPGFYAGDGVAAESSASSGKIWRALLRPPQTGLWKYRVSFRTGSYVAADADPTAGNPAGFNGEAGTFTVTNSDKTGRDFRATGRVSYVKEAYLKYAETDQPKKYFIKNGVDSPENFLAYVDFDATKSKRLHYYPKHIADWQPGDPTWKGGKGKAIIGALNYMASRSLNSMYFLTYNVDGDSKDVWMWTSNKERERFDVSKLDQWEIVFEHMDQLGISMHVVTQETENDNLLSNGTLGTHRKLYYRELVARYAHHLGVVWNLGEEFSLSAKKAREFGNYFKALDPYQNMVVLHTLPEKGPKEQLYGALLGSNAIDGASLQVNVDTENNNAVVREWIKRSKAAGKTWVVQHDETGPVGKYCLMDSEDPSHYAERSKVLWSTLLAGGGGVEWIYFSKKVTGTDINTEDFRLRERLHNYSTHGVNFMQQYLPFWEMTSSNSTSIVPGVYVFAKEGEIYAAYLPRKAKGSLKLPSGDYQVHWYDPRLGGQLQQGSVKQVNGGGTRSLGAPPSKSSEDWVALIRKI